MANPAARILAPAMIAVYWMTIGAVFGAITGWLAVARNRSALIWWLVGVVFGPFGFVALLNRGPREDPRLAIL